MAVERFESIDVLVNNVGGSDIRRLEDLTDDDWQTSFELNLMSAVRYVAKSVSDAKRGHDERLAREDVQRALADYCAGQPDSTAGIQMCSTLPAVR